MRGWGRVAGPGSGCGAGSGRGAGSGLGADAELRGRAPRVGAAAAPGAVRGADRGPWLPARSGPAAPRPAKVARSPPAPAVPPYPGLPTPGAPPPTHPRDPHPPGTPPGPTAPAGRSAPPPRARARSGRAAPRAPVGARAGLGVRGPRLPHPPTAAPGAQSAARTPASVPAPFPPEGGGPLGWRPRAKREPGCPARFPAWQAQTAPALCALPGFRCPPGNQRGNFLHCGLPPLQPCWHCAMFPARLLSRPMRPDTHPESTAEPFHCWAKLLAPQGNWGICLPTPYLTHSLCTDNLWSDQSLETDPDLPPSWRKICDSLGTYYWHVPTGTTQWQHPARTTGPGGHTEADGEETLQGRVGNVGRGVRAGVGFLSWQNPAEGSSGHDWSSLPLEHPVCVTLKSCSAHSCLGLSPLKCPILGLVLVGLILTTQDAHNLVAALGEGLLPGAF